MAPGPLLSLVVSETLRGNKLNGIFIAIAPLLTDLPIVLISIYVLRSISHIDLALGLLSLAGGVFLAYLGVKNIRSLPSTTDNSNSYNVSLKYGVVTNFLSPHPYLFWIAVGAPTFVKASKSSLNEGIAFIFAFYLLLIGTKIIIAIISERFGKILDGSRYKMIMRSLGILLLFLAGVMLYDGIELILTAKDVPF